MGEFWKVLGKNSRDGLLFEQKDSSACICISKSPPPIGRNTTVTLFAILAIVYLSLRPALAATQNTAEVGETAVAAFKTYLSTPPCITRLIYSEISPASAPRKFVLALHNKDFYLRQIRDGENYKDPITKSNMMHGEFFAGRSGEMNWQISGFGLAKSYPDLAKPDAYTVFAETTKYIANGILNLGPQMIMPGSFSWTENTFKAQPSAVALQFKPDLKTIDGMVRVENGKVVELDCPMGGSFRYEYDSSAGLPKGFPARILSMLDGKKWTPVIQFHEVIFGNPETMDEAQFTPERHISSDVTLLTVVSNNQVILQPKANSARVVNLVKLELADKKKNVKSWRRAIVLGVFAILLFLPAVYCLLRFRSKTTATT